LKVAAERRDRRLIDGFNGMLAEVHRRDVELIRHQEGSSA
jgi:hypothetical protein